MDHESDSEMFDLHGDDCYVSEEMDIGIPQYLCNGEDVSYMFDETTPVKACGDFVTENVNVIKEAEKRNALYLQVKRRRMLQFQNEDMASVFLKIKDREDSLEDALADVSQWVSSFSVDAFDCADLDQSSEGWLANCFSNSEMNNSPSDASLSEAPDVQNDISDFCNSPPGYQATVSKKSRNPRRRNVIFKGKNSLIQTQTKASTSVAFPFDIIKPCGYYGDTTLNEINQRLHKPSSSRHKINSEDISASVPISAFSGKPILGKTTVRTDGGRGTITIMKTKG